MEVLIVVVGVTLFVSAQCSLYEATLYSTRIGALEGFRARGRHPALARKLIEMKRHIAVPISAILILNTLANTAGATIAGMYARDVLGTHLVPAFSLTFTMGILFLSEILPKTLGVVYWRSLWPSIVWPLTILKFLLYPAIIVTQRFAEFITGRQGTPIVSEEEILGAARLGAKAGEISYWESRMVHNIIGLEDRAVREIMTPRSVMFTLNADTTVKDAVQAATQAGFTRIPTYSGRRENIVGYVTIQDLAGGRFCEAPETRVGTLVRPIAFVPETSNCLTLMATFLKKRRHIAVVKDQNDGVAGLVTLEDLLETILGEEIVDESDRVVDLRNVFHAGR